MAGVLRSVAGIDTVKWGIAPSAQGNTAYVEYRAAPSPQGGSYRPTIRFQTAKIGGTYIFTAGLSGLAPAEREPPDWGTSAIMDEWKKTCGATAGVIYN